MANAQKKTRMTPLPIILVTVQKGSVGLALTR